jgi:hypothetical protein
MARPIEIRAGRENVSAAGDAHASPEAIGR